MFSLQSLFYPLEIGNNYSITRIAINLIDNSRQQEHQQEDVVGLFIDIWQNSGDINTLEIF